jgi:hypothetical protein
MGNRVVIAGGGAAGLLAAWVFRRRKPTLDIKVVEAGNVGGEFGQAGGLRYLHHSDAMEDLINALDLPYSDFTVEGGILLRGKVLPYPECFKELPTDEVAAVRNDHYLKTRGMYPDLDVDFAAKSMNDPGRGGNQKALRCDFKEMLGGLVKGVDIVKARVVGGRPGQLLLEGADPLPFDHLVVTIPLWILKDRMWFQIPDAACIKLNVAIVASRASGAYMQWDYVYTPYTPENYVHRFSHFEDGYMVEANGTLDEDRLQGDLHFIFQNGFIIRSVRSGLSGHLLPISQKPAWPKNVAPLGRFAAWEPRATLDVVLDEAEKLAKRWFGGHA